MIARQFSLPLRFFHAIRSIRLRLFLMLSGLSLGIILAANLVWLPSSIREIRENQEQLREVAVRSAQFQIRQFLRGLEGSLDRAGLQVQVALMANDRGRIRDISQNLFQQQSSFEEIGVLDATGRQIFRESRRLLVSDEESPFAASVRNQQTRITWGPVVLTETSEPWVPLAIHRPLGKREKSIFIYGVVNLKRLNQLAEAFKVGNGGALHLVDRSGGLVADADAGRFEPRARLNVPLGR
jgi:hypothetical protein